MKTHFKDGCIYAAKKNSTTDWSIVTCKYCLQLNPKQEPDKLLHCQTLHKSCELRLRKKCWWEHETRMHVVKNWEVICDKCLANMKKARKKGWVNPGGEFVKKASVIRAADLLRDGYAWKDICDGKVR